MAPPRIVKSLAPTDAGYIAGLLDGEGTITLSRVHRNERRRLVVCISNNELSITPRNGKYSADTAAARTSFEVELLAVGPQT